MTYRGIVKNGVIVIEAGGELPDGQVVDVTTVSTTAPRGDSKTENLPAFGLWKDRGEWSDSAEAARQLRQMTESREGTGGGVDR